MKDLGDLDIFARVVSSGSMSAAGRDLGLSPAVISKRLRRLEERLGVRLLQRTTRQLSLTDTGHGYYERVVGILNAIEEADAFAARRSAVAKGLLRVSAPTSFGRMHVAPHLDAFLQSNPDVSIDLALSDNYVDIVGEGIDVAIRIGELSDSSLVAKKLAPLHRCLCSAPQYLEKHGAPKTIAELQEHLCLTANNQNPWRLHGPDGVHVFSVESRLRTNSSEAITAAVLSGLGIALRSTWDIGPQLVSGELEIVLPDYSASPNVAIYAVYPSKRYLPAKVRLFIDYLASLYGPSPTWDDGLKL